MVASGKTHTSAVDIAAHLIRLAAIEEEPDLLSPMRLQKLLYYVQGWALAELDQPAFADSIEAWRHGPVVPEVYSRFKEFGKSVIPIDAVEDPNLSEFERELVDQVWDAYKRCSATALSEMTHRELPWIEAREGLMDNDHSKREIRTESIRSFFAQKIDRINETLVGRIDDVIGRASENCREFCGMLEL